MTVYNFNEDERRADKRFSFWLGFACGAGALWGLYELVNYIN